MEAVFLLCLPTRTPNCQRVVGSLVIPYIEFTNSKNLGASVCEGGGVLKHAYSKFSVFIESS